MSSESAILQLLGSIPANAITLPKLVEQLQTRNLVIPFVGAGMSVPFGYPQWGEFLLKTAELAGKADIESVEEHLGAGRYEEAAELLIIALEQRCFNDQMESYFGDEVRKSKILSGAILQLPRLGSGPVITTNFDGLLEEAFRSQGHPFELVVTGSNPGQAIGALQQDRGVLVKIHGEWNRPNDRVLTLTEYQRAYGASDAAQINFENHLPKLLQSILSTRPALFLGCSLSQDRTMAILKRIASNYPESAHYAIIEQPLDPDAFQKRAQYLSGQGIRPIWYPPGQHQLIEPLVSFLGDQIPQSLRRGARKGKRGNIPRAHQAFYRPASRTCQAR